MNCSSKSRTAVGASRNTLSPLPSPLPLTVKLVVAPAVPAVVAGNVSEVMLTFSAGAVPDGR